MRQRQADAPVAADVVIAADRRRNRRVLVGKGLRADDSAIGGDVRVGIGIHPDEIDARGRLQPERPTLEVLEREQAQFLVLAVGQIFLVAADPEVLVQVLDAAGPAPAVMVGLDEGGAHLAAVRIKA